MRTYTQKGRVVYNRPKHEFNRVDVARVMRKVYPSSVGLWVGPDIMNAIRDVFRPRPKKKLGLIPAEPLPDELLQIKAALITGDELTDDAIYRKLLGSNVFFFVSEEIK